MINKDLGMVTAYAYAVSKGYAGTEDEFATLMASYATVGQTAVDAALAAKASEDAAKASETAAGASETAAATSASTAATAAQNASESATTASGKATEATTAATAAAGSATTAGNKATEAAQSATAAAGSATAADTAKTAAQAAQTAAETAQTAAETAQGAAEDAAESVSASAAQIAQNTADISDVKNALQEIDATLITDEASGAIATFSDGADGYPMRSVTVALEPIQDLHGQDAPYPGGGGKNKYPLIIGEDGFEGNSGGTHSNNNGTLVVNCTADSNSGVYAKVSSPLRQLPANYNNEAFTYSFDIKASKSASVLAGYERFGYRTISVTTSWQRITTTATADGSSSALVIYNRGNDSVEVEVKDFQFELGSTATAYAPYSNICPISGRSEVGVWRSGVNVWDEEWEVGEINNSTGVKGVGTVFVTKNYISVLPSTTYYWKAPYGGTRYFYDKDKTFISTVYPSANTAFTTPDNAAYMMFKLPSQYGTTYQNDISINYPSTDHEYHPHDIPTITLQLGQTVYGGTVDAVSGVMTVDRAMVDLGTLTWSTKSTAVSGKNRFSSALPNAIASVSSSPTSLCSEYKLLSSGGTYDITSDGYTISNSGECIFYIDAYAGLSPSDFASAVSGVQLVYTLATPVTIQLTAQQLTSLLGTNNVWSDGGNVSVDYVADTKLYISKVIAAALA